MSQLIIHIVQLHLLINLINVIRSIILIGWNMLRWCYLIGWRGHRVTSIALSQGLSVLGFFRLNLERKEELVPSMLAELSPGHSLSGAVPRLGGKTGPQPVWVEGGSAGPLREVLYVQTPPNPQDHRWPSPWRSLLGWCPPTTQTLRSKRRSDYLE